MINKLNKWISNWPKLIYLLLEAWKRGIAALTKVEKIQKQRIFYFLEVINLPERNC